MAEHGHNQICEAGYIRFCSLSGDMNANLGESLGLKPALLPELAAPQINASLPKMGG